MPTFHGGFEIFDDDDIEVLEVRHKRRTRVNFLEPYQHNLPPANQTQPTQSHRQLYKEALDRFRSKILPKSNTNEETDATSKLGSEDEIMTDSMAELTEKGFVKLPSLHQILPEEDSTREPDRTIDRPYYNEWAHCEGFVAWWDNRTGKGMIIDHRNNLEHKIDIHDIKLSHYGALVPGSMVEYEYYDDRVGKGFNKFWVVSGCEYVLWEDAWADDKKYPYMQPLKQEYYERGRRGGA